MVKYLFGPAMCTAINKYTFVLFAFFHLGCVQQNKISSKTIQAKEIINSIKKNKAIHYAFCTIEGDLDFTKLSALPVNNTTERSSIATPLFFESCTFSGTVSAFYGGDSSATISNFHNNVSFYNCLFKEDVDFTSTNFKDIVIFTKSIFDKKIKLQGALFENDLRMDEAFFSDHVMMQECVIRGSFGAKQATVSGQLLLQQADFWQHASLAGITVHQYADFGLANFRRGAFFEYGEYFKTVNYSGAIFSGNAEWNKTHFHQSVDYSNTLFTQKPVFNNVKIQGEVKKDNVQCLSKHCGAEQFNSPGSPLQGE